MRWREYGARLVAARREGKPYYMLDDIAYVYIEGAAEPISFEELCGKVSEHTGIVIEDVLENLDFIVDGMERQGILLKDAEGRYSLNRESNPFLSPLADNLGYKPDAL